MLSDRLVFRAAGHALLAQLLRYAFVGAVLSGLSTLTYLLPALLLGVPPLIANFLSYVVAVSAGYVLHGRVSFPGHDRNMRPAMRRGRFFLVSLLSLALNSLFVWVFTGWLGLSPWYPLPAMLCVTPLVTFYLNRKWVFA
ncbi:MAG TPA: GtrA family protein [Allosphingosinicella sp.]|jgi:putative flippase GtrA